MNLSAPRGSRMTLLVWFSAANRSKRMIPVREERSAAGGPYTFGNSNLPSRLLLSHNHTVTAREMANSICETLLGRGYQALLVGGCVRDLLLGREPADYDVSTDATPEQVMALFRESVAVGAQFGVILIPRDGLKVEVATFRSDVSYSDGR